MHLPTQNQNLNIFCLYVGLTDWSNGCLSPVLSAQVQRQTQHKTQIQFNFNINTSLDLKNCIADSPIYISHSCKIHCI